MQKKEKNIKIKHKMNDLQADWSTIGYVPIFNLIVLLINRKDQPITAHTVRGLFWNLNVFIPIIIISILRSNFDSLSNINNWMTIMFFINIIAIIYTFILIIDYILYFIDCRRYVYRPHFIDKIYNKPINKVCTWIEEKNYKNIQ